ncbi:MAG: ATPase, T2SS/T4P/T4SS family [Deltaproteobacteria bacterium]
MALRLGELLKSKGFVSDAQLNVAMAQQTITGDLLGDTLVKLAFVSSREMAQVLAEQAGTEFLDLFEYPPTDEALRLVPRDIAEKTGFLPLSVGEKGIAIGVTNLTNILAIDTAAKLTGKPPRVYMVDSDSFYATLERAYYFLENPIHKRIDAIVNDIKNAVAQTAATVASLSEMIIMDGIKRNATDIHIMPAAETVHILYRIDGVLQHARCLPRSTQNGIVSRIKILSQLDIAEQRLPQDGSFTFSFLSRKYDMRISTIPTIYGENVVIRVLGGSGLLLRISSLGFDEQDTERLKLLFSKPYGIILITGPTGSGKTTTLYAALREIDLLEKNVITVEDPVEYKLSFVRQTEVNEKAGYDFALAGRNFMRQDPDVILLGEIRDEETSKIAIRSSITGHLVLATLHTNDAVTSIPRLVDLNVDRYLLSASILAVVAQRLVRKICMNCKAEVDIENGYLRSIGLPDLEGKVKKAHKGAGCVLCSHTGYAGRISIGEILIVNDEIKELIYSGASVQAIKEAASRNGMKTLRDAGIRKAIAGITTFEDVVRVAG